MGSSDEDNNGSGSDGLGGGEVLGEARRALEAETSALTRAGERLGAEIVEALRLVLESSSHVAVLGMGKSGHVGRKIAATLASTGTPATFVNAAEAEHGDLGMIAPGAPVIAVSKSGATPELLRSVETLKLRGSKLVGIVGNLQSPLARRCDVVLDGAVEEEADYLGIVPTTSTTVALALGDALACARMKARGFGRADFLVLHSGGQLGAGLRLKTKEVMRTGEDMPVVAPDAKVIAVIDEISRKRQGGTCVAEDGRLLGLVTDGDLRRALNAHRSFDMQAFDIMNPAPETAAPDAELIDVMQVVQRGGVFKELIPVVDSEGLLVGTVWRRDLDRVAEASSGEGE